MVSEVEVLVTVVEMVVVKLLVVDSVCVTVVEKVRVVSEISKTVVVVVPVAVLVVRTGNGDRSCNWYGFCLGIGLRGRSGAWYIHGGDGSNINCPERCRRGNCGGSRCWNYRSGKRIDAASCLRFRGRCRYY